MREFAPKEAARFLQAHGFRTTVASLATMRTRGGGPQYRLAGRYVLYPEALLTEWVRRHRSGILESTSSLPGFESDRSYEPDQGDLPENDYRNTGDRAFDEITRLNERGMDLDAELDAQLKRFEYHAELDRV